MTIKGLELVWIVVKDVKQSIKFYTETVGMKLCIFEEKFGWAELSGDENGARLGIAQQSEREPIQPGENGIITLTVDCIETTVKELVGRGVVLRGKRIEIPGVVKLQMMADLDGNQFQIVETSEH